MNKLVIISGCSGGGKSTLLSELSKEGYTVIEEVGRKIVKEYGEIDPQLLCELIVTKSIQTYHEAQQIKLVKDDVIFFDRSFLEGISYFQSINVNKYDHFINELRYDSRIFIAPPWKEIYVQHDERKHSFEDGVREYDRLMKFYPKYGYQMIELPKLDVKERVKFILSKLSVLNE